MLTRVALQRRRADWAWDARQLGYLTVAAVLGMLILLYPAAIRASIIRGPQYGAYSVSLNGALTSEAVEQLREIKGVTRVGLAANMVPNRISAHHRSLHPLNGYFFVSGQPEAAGPLSAALRLRGGPLRRGVAIDWASARRLHVRVGQALTVRILQTTFTVPVEAIYEPTGRLKSAVVFPSSVSEGLVKQNEEGAIASDAFAVVGDRTVIEAIRKVGGVVNGRNVLQVKTRAEELAAAKEEYAKVVPSFWRNLLIGIAVAVVAILIRREQVARQDRQLEDSVHLQVLGVTPRRVAAANAVDFVASIAGAGVLGLILTSYLAENRFIVLVPPTFRPTVLMLVVVFVAVAWLQFFIGGVRRLQRPMTLVERGD